MSSEASEGLLHEVALQDNIEIEAEEEDYFTDEDNIDYLDNPNHVELDETQMGGRSNSLPLVNSMQISSTSLQVSSSMCELRHQTCPRCNHPMPPAFLDFQTFRCEKCAFKSEFYCVKCDAVISNEEVIGRSDTDKEIDPSTKAYSRLVCQKCSTSIGSWSELIYYTFSYDWTEVHQCPQCPAKIDGLKYRCINCHTLMICPENETPSKCVACKSDLSGFRQYYTFLNDRQWLNASAWIDSVRRVACL